MGYPMGYPMGYYEFFFTHNSRLGYPIWGTPWVATMIFFHTQQSFGVPHMGYPMGYPTPWVATMNSYIFTSQPLQTRLLFKFSIGRPSPDPLKVVQQNPRKKNYYIQLSHIFTGNGGLGHPNYSNCLKGLHPIRFLTLLHHIDG